MMRLMMEESKLWWGEKVNKKIDRGSVSPREEREDAKRRAFGKLKKEEINVVWHWLDLDMILVGERLREKWGKTDLKRVGKTKFIKSV